MLVDYQPIGSPLGSTELRSSSVDFAVSDVPMADAQLLRDGLIQFALLIGAIAPVVNVPGIPSGQLHLSGGLLPDISRGRVTA